MYMSSVFYGTIYIRNNRLPAFGNFESKFRKEATQKNGMGRVQNKNTECEQMIIKFISTRKRD